MKKSWQQFYVGVLSTFLLGGSLFGGSFVFGNDQVIEREENPISQTSVESGLTPRRSSRQSLVLGQQTSRPLEIPSTLKAAPIANETPRVSPPAVVDAPKVAMKQQPAVYSPDCNASPVIGDMGMIYAELQRQAAEIDKLKKDTKKPDTKKAWSTPKITGRFFVDAYAVNQSNRSYFPYGNIKNDAGVREMQIAASGTGFDSFDYKVEFSLNPNNGRVALVDNWLGVKNMPLLGYVRVGHYKPETGLAYPTSALNTTLTEFVGPTSAFGLGRRVGISSANLFANDRLRLFMGVFQEGATNIDRHIQEDDQGQVFNMRASFAPIYADGGRHVLHLGGHWSYVSPKNATTSMKTNVGSIGWLQETVKTGDFDNNHNHRFGFEAAYQRGAFAVQSEIFATRFSAYKDDKAKTAHGAYVELRYFLTGEHRAYNLASGNFGGVKPKCNFHPYAKGDWNLIDGFGAWQAVLQWSYLDLTDWRSGGGLAGNRLGGRQNDITLGVNWFWTPNIRWIFEYVHSEQNIGSDKLSCYEDIIGTSIRYNF